MNKSFVFETAKKIVCKAGSVNDVGLHCLSNRMIDNVLIITDPGLRNNTTIPSQLYDAVRKCVKNVSIFSEIEPDPKVSSVYAAIAHAKTRGAVSGVIGLGGGSSMDVAKVK